ncbi:hypothetical protein JCM19239_4100 [Vibrio variabilis]|uniref:Uncharacterized protein n=1 Tax=Vibrio variabilis TaxID=990271 RepID=A0ABQ0J6Q6_9VIBR|nr:hypothetical protein JCM19239_4100 [Vibrio variabilis]
MNPCGSAVSVEAHYREPIQLGKPFLDKKFENDVFEEKTY